MIEDQEYEFDEAWPLWMREWVLPYTAETALWPVLFAIAGHFVVVYALMLVSVWRDGLAGSWGWLLFSVLSSGAPVAWELKLFRRPGAVALVVTLTWIASLVVAWIGVRTEFI